MGGRLRRKEEMMMEWMEGGEAEEKGKTVLPSGVSINSKNGVFYKS